MTKSTFLGKFLTELRRRNVIRTSVAYLGSCWLLLQFLDVASQLMIIDVIVGAFMFIFLLCLFPVVIYISWHFQFTNSTWVRTATVDFDEDGEPVIPPPLGWGSWVGLVMIISLSLGIGYQYFHVVKDRQDIEADGLVKIVSADSIAVLPFVDQSADKDQSYLAIGLAEELTSLLGQTDGFRVAASRSSQVLTDKGFSPVDIGRRLNVQTVLSGSVVNVGNRVKIRVELLDTKNGHTLWTENFLREMKDIFDLQSEIGRSVVNLLQDKYLESGSLRSLSATNSTDAYVVYLKGREAYRLQTTESFKEARKLFEQAIALDPEYAQAYVSLADTLALLGDGSTQYGVLANDVAATLAERNVEKALVRQPNMPRAYAVVGYIAMIRDEFEKSLGAFDKAIELNPSLAIAYMWKSRALAELQRFDESFAALIKANELDPLFRSATYNLGVELEIRGRYQEAEDIYKQLLIDYPDFPSSHSGLAGIYFSQGNYSASIQEAYLAHKLSPENEELKIKLIGSLLQLKLTDIIRTLTDDPIYDATLLLIEKNYQQLFKNMDFEVAANPDDYWVAFEAGWYNAMVGDKSKAVTLLTEKQAGLSETDKFSMPYCSPAIEIAWAHKQLGQIDQFNKIHQQCESLKNDQIDSSIKYFELDYLAARLAALNGDPNSALGNLETAIKNGWREWWTHIDPLLDSIKDEPKFKEQMLFLENELSKQRQEVREFYKTVE